MEWKELARCVREEVKGSRPRGLQISARAAGGWSHQLRRDRVGQGGEGCRSRQIGGLVFGCVDFEMLARPSSGASRQALGFLGRESGSG